MGVGKKEGEFFPGGGEFSEGREEFCGAKLPTLATYTTDTHHAEVCFYYRLRFPQILHIKGQKLSDIFMHSRLHMAPMNW